MGVRWWRPHPADWPGPGPGRDSRRRAGSSPPGSPPSRPRRWRRDPPRRRTTRGTCWKRRWSTGSIERRGGRSLCWRFEQRLEVGVEAGLEDGLEPSCWIKGRIKCKAENGLEARFGRVGGCYIFGGWLFGAEEGNKEWRLESPFPGSAVDGVTVTFFWISRGRGHRFLFSI